MQPVTHLKRARELLEAGKSEYRTGDEFVASRQFWEAGYHALAAIAEQRGWEYGTRAAQKQAARRLADETGQPALMSGFGVAEKLFFNHQYYFMEGDDYADEIAAVSDFVAQIAGLLAESPNLAVAPPD